MNIEVTEHHSRWLVTFESVQNLCVSFDTENQAMKFVRIIVLSQTGNFQMMEDHQDNH